MVDPEHAAENIIMLTQNFPIKYILYGYFPWHFKFNSTIIIPNANHENRWKIIMRVILNYFKANKRRLTFIQETPSRKRSVIKINSQKSTVKLSYINDV